MYLAVTIVQARDLRLLDAQPASSPPAILCRDRAIVVNLEFIKCIVTTGASGMGSSSSSPTQYRRLANDVVTTCIGQVAVSGDASTDYSWDKAR